MGYKLQSIELVVVGDNSPGNFRTDVRNTKAELWSSVKSGDRAGHPKQKNHRPDGGSLSNGLTPWFSMLPRAPF